MSKGFSTLVRDLIPVSYQVPAKYWYRALRGNLEDEMRYLKLVVMKGDKVIDVGGNRGIYAYYLWRLGAEVEVFEPNPACSRVLETWAAGRERVSVHSVALSDQEGSGALHIPIDDSGIEHDASASIEKVEFSKSREELVVLRTLDSFNFSSVSLIKIDVEGHEYGVIEGASELISSSQPALLVEIEQRHNRRPIDKVFDKIQGFGYQGFFWANNSLETIDKFDVLVHQPMKNFAASVGPYINNFLFLHRDRLEKGQYDALVKGVPAR